MTEERTEKRCENTAMPLDLEITNVAAPQHQPLSIGISSTAASHITFAIGSPIGIIALALRPAHEISNSRVDKRIPLSLGRRPGLRNYVKLPAEV